MSPPNGSHAGSIRRHSLISDSPHEEDAAQQALWSPHLADDWVDEESESEPEPEPQRRRVVNLDPRQDSQEYLSQARARINSAGGRAATPDERERRRRTFGETSSSAEPEFGDIHQALAELRSGTTIIQDTSEERFRPLGRRHARVELSVILRRTEADANNQSSPEERSNESLAARPATGDGSSPAATTPSTPTIFREEDFPPLGQSGSYRQVRRGHYTPDYSSAWRSQ